MAEQPSAQPTQSKKFSSPGFVDPWAAAREYDMRVRLAAVGATADEIEAFIDQFLHDPGWDHLDKERVVALGDGKLHAEVLRARADGLRDTETEDEEQARLAAEAESAAAIELRREAERMSAYEPPQILDWVGRSADRARAVLRVEEEHPLERASLIAALLRVIDDRLRTP